MGEELRQSSFAGVGQLAEGHGFRVGQSAGKLLAPESRVAVVQGEGLIDVEGE